MCLCPQGVLCCAGRILVTPYPIVPHGWPTYGTCVLKRACLRKNHCPDSTSQFSITLGSVQILPHWLIAWVLSQVTRVAFNCVNVYTCTQIFFENPPQSDCAKKHESREFLCQIGTKSARTDWLLFSHPQGLPTYAWKSRYTRAAY